MDQISVLLVEDAELFRDGLRAAIETAGERLQLVGQTDNAPEALRLISELVPDVVLLDLKLDDTMEEAFRLISRVRDLSPATRVVVVSAYGDDTLVFRAIKMGATGYLLKESLGRAEVLQHIECASRDDPVLAPSVARKILAYFRRGERSDRSQAPVEKLSEREQEILNYVAQGLTNMEIAKLLSISDKTVKTHVSNILAKLHLSSRLELKLYAQVKQPR